jgi:hypothetical protein
VVVVGLTFFKNKVLMIDIDEGRLALIPAKAKVQAYVESIREEGHVREVD